MGDSDPSPDSLTLEGVGGLFNGEVFVLVPGQSGTIGKSSIATFPVTVCRNYRRLEGDPSRDGLLDAMHPEHVRILYVGGGRLIVENLAGFSVTVGHRDVPDRLDVDLAEGGVEVSFGYGERILATCPGSKDQLQELAPRRDPAAAAEGVFMALLRPDGTLAIGDVEEDTEYSLAPFEGAADPETDTGEIPELTEEELATAREKARPRRKRRFFGLRPSVFFSVLFHLVVILGLFSTIHLIERRTGGDWTAEVSMEAPKPPAPERDTPPETDRVLPDESTDMDPMTPTIDESQSESFSDEAGQNPGETRAGAGHDGLAGTVGVGAGGLGDLGPGATGPTRNSGGRGGKKDTPQERALAWLAEHQLREGSWGGITSLTKCGKCSSTAQREYGVAMTGLAILAFTHGGNSHRKGPYAPRVMRAVRWLVKRQQDNGSFHPRGTHRDDREIYGDAIASLALAELCSEDGTPLLKSALARGLRHLERAQTPYAGWRYQPGEVESDTSVTAWAMLAFSAAERVGVAVNPSVRVGARAWLSTVIDPSTHRVGYSRRGRGSLGMNAAGLTMMLGMNRVRFAQPIRAAQKLLRGNLPLWVEPGEAPPPGNPPDLNYWFFGTMAARQSGGDLDRNWSRAIRRVLIRNQEGSGHARGSFTPFGRWSRVGGRVYTTATAAVLF